MLKEEVNPGNFFLRMQPIHRFIASLLFCTIAYFIIASAKIPGLIQAMFLRNVFAITYLVFSWIVLLKRSVSQIRQTAKKDDGSVIYVFLLVVLSCFTSLVMVLLLVISKDKALTGDPLYIPVAVAGILLSWIMVHSIYTFHYAHLYYDDDKKQPGKDAFGLEFPGNEKPNYIDFAYFAFVIGCTFQVSDVEISSPKIRRIALVHGLLSFCLNTFVVALTVNLVAGLSK